MMSFQSVPASHATMHVPTLKGESGDGVRLRPTYSNESTNFVLEGAENVSSQTREEYTKVNLNVYRVCIR